MSLSKDQKKIVYNVLLNENIFITGSAGCGKSFVISNIIDQLKYRKIIFVTATTGVAAVNIGGITINSFSGIGKGDLKCVDYIKCMKNETKENWTSVDILIIDEISMLSLETFELIDSVAKIVRKCDKPFGGVQLIVS